MSSSVERLVVGHPSTWGYDWTLKGRSDKTTTQKVVQYISLGTWTCLSGFICIPSILATLSERTGSAGHRISADFSTAGTSLSWFSLTFYGGFVLISEVAANKSKIEIYLFKDDTPTVAKAIMLGMGIILALTSRIVSVAEGVMFTKHKTFGLTTGIISSVAEAGLPALGFYLLLRDLTKYIRTRYISEVADKQIEKLRKYLVRITQSAVQWSLRSTKSERLERFKTLYGSVHGKDIETIKQEWQELLGVIAGIHASRVDQRNCAKIFLKDVPVKLIQSSTTTTAIPLFIMDALLAGTVYEMMQFDDYKKTLGMIFAFMPLIYLAPKMIWGATEKVSNLLYDRFWDRDDKSFGDAFYPKLSSLIKLAAFGVSITQFDEQIALSKQYTKEGTPEFNFLSYGNIVACSLMITASFYMIIDGLYEKFALSSYANEDVRDAAQIKLKLDRMIRLFQEMRADHLAKMLDTIDDPELKSQILNGQITVDQLVSLHRQEETPLLQQV